MGLRLAALKRIKLKTVGKVAGKIGGGVLKLGKAAARFAPGFSQVLSAYDAYQDLRGGSSPQSPMDAIGMPQPGVPMVGPMLPGQQRPLVDPVTGLPIRGRKGFGFGAGRRRKGISSRDLRTTRRTLRTIVKLYHKLPKQRSSGRSSGGSWRRRY